LITVGTITEPLLHASCCGWAHITFDPVLGDHRHVAELSHLTFKSSCIHLNGHPTVAELTEAAAVAAGAAGAVQGSDEEARKRLGDYLAEVLLLDQGTELILAALDLTGQRHDRFVERFRGTSAEEITAGYLDLWRRIPVRSRLESGCPILALTVSVPAGPLLDRAGAIFRTSQRLLVDLYEEVGVLRSAAERFVTFLVASAEGAVVLSRAQQDIEPFEVVADQLIQQAVAMPKVVSTTADHQAPATRTRVKRAASNRG
jgi:TetR/AcrR family transcriptional regulator, lmrAB and yxaGH operons repressor